MIVSELQRLPSGLRSVGLRLRGVEPAVCRGLGETIAAVMIPWPPGHTNLISCLIAAPPLSCEAYFRIFVYIPGYSFANTAFRWN